MTRGSDARASTSPTSYCPTARSGRFDSASFGGRITGFLGAPGGAAAGRSAGLPGIASAGGGVTAGRGCVADARGGAAGGAGDGTAGRGCVAEGRAAGGPTTSSVERLGATSPDTAASGSPCTIVVSSVVKLIHGRIECFRPF